MLDVLINLQHRRRAHRVGRVAAVAFGLQLGKFKRGFTAKVGIYEQYQVRSFQIQRMFHLKLEIGQVFDAGAWFGLQPFQQQRTERVIATARIAVTKN